MRNWIIAIALLLLAAPMPAAAQPQDISQPGTVPHIAARAGFPEQVGEFRRVHVLRYAENDISANYDLRRGQDFLRLSVYIYPAPHVPASERAAACRDVMASVNQSTMDAHKDMEQRESGEAPAVPDTDPALRHRTIFRVTMPFFNSEDPIPVRRENRLYCYVGGDWLVKFFASSNADFDVDGAIDSFIRSGPWAGRGAGGMALRRAEPVRDPEHG